MKINTNIKKHHCKDCRRTIDSRALRCKKCYRIWQTKYPELQSNYQDGHSINRVCNDCSKPLNRGIAVRCWNCFKKFKTKNAKPFPKCLGCGKTLTLKNSLRCSKCGRKHLSEICKGKPRSEKHRIAVRKCVIKRWKNPEYRTKIIKAILKANNLTPNKSELILKKILNKLFPKQYRFVGNGNLIIDRFNPDFVNMKQKKIIEFFGTYWHNLPTYKQRDKKRLKVYQKEGYKTLIIWENELKNLKILIKKLISFNKN